jgi:hypothetical protein
MGKQTDERRPHDDKFTLDLTDATEYLGISSKGTFRRRFIESGLVQLIDLGGRSPHVLRSEVDAAVLKIAAEQKANPALFVPRSGGAVLKARGKIGNKWGRHGKPAEAKSPSKRKTAKPSGA